MSLPMDHPVLTTGDSLDQFGAWRVSGLRDSNSHRGRLYISTLPDAAGIKLDIYKDRERTTLVATGTGAVGGRVTASASGNDPLEVSALVNADSAAETVTLWAALATTDDLAERDDRLREFLLRDPPEIDFEVVMRATSRALYLELQASYPPPTRVGDPLAFPGTGSVQESGRRGLPEVESIALWRLNAEGEWELSGLQNPGDYREWAILFGLALVWERRARSREDPVLERAMVYRDRAAAAFSRVPVLVDVDADLLPERRVRVRSATLRRG